MPEGRIVVDQLGYVRPCCIYSGLFWKDRDVVNLEKHTLFDYLASPELKDLKEKLQVGRPPECERCWNDEKLQRESKRLQYKDFRSDKFCVEVYLSNVCNLTCVTCSYKHSTAWTRESIDTGIISSEEWKKYDAKTTSYQENLLQSIKKLIDQDKIYQFDFLGGEPLLDKQHLEILDYAIESGRSSSITLSYITNGTISNSRLLERFSHFAKIIFSISIDGTKERFQYLRHPAQWSTIEKNILDFSLVPNLELHFTHTISWLNVFYLEEFISWASHWIDRRKATYHINYVTEPSYFSIEILPARVKEKIISSIGARDAHTSHLIQSLKTSGSQESIQSLKQGYSKIHLSDNYRKTNYAEIFPEFFELINPFLVEVSSK